MITKAEILIDVNENLKRAETDIDVQIRKILYDISSRDDILSTSSVANTTTATLAYYALSTVAPNFKSLKSIVLNSGSDGKPLTLITWDDYLKRVAASSSNSEPTEYVIHNDLIWLSPTPGATYTMKIFYYRYHPTSVDSILFDEIFRDCINAGVTFKVAQSKQLKGDVAVWSPQYEYEISKRLGNLIKDPVFTKYTDI